MKKVTIFFAAMLIVWALPATGQDLDYVLDVPVTDVFTDAFPTGIQSGVRAVAGPFDMDGDGLMEVIATDYTGGGRVHVIENVDASTWEWVYSTPWLDSTATTSYNVRYAYATNADADLDGDGHGEIIVPTGRSFADTTAGIGMYIFEHTGTDNDYGTAPASILDLDPADRIRVQTEIVAEDIDGDGTVELFFSNNGLSADDFWFVYSVNGDIGSGFETWVQELAINPRNTDHGGGSPNAVFVANLDGDADDELVLHSWNNYNFTIGHATGADTYDFPEGMWNHVDASDGTTYAGGTVIDINDDGDDELYLSYYCCSTGPAHQNRVALINYEAGESADSVGSANVVLGLIAESFPWGLTSGDLDNDGNKEVIGVGMGFGGSARTAGDPAVFARIAEFTGGQGGDPEDTANYEVTDVVSNATEIDTVGFNTVYRDSAGTVTKLYEGPAPFGFRAAYLGDADNDGMRELAIGFQSIADSVDVIDRIWNADSLRFDDTTRVRTAATARPFVRILSFGDRTVAIESDRIVIPDDYKLMANYPNPFNGGTTIEFELPLDKRISVKVYDITGRLVRAIVDDELTPKGLHSVTWDGTTANGAKVASGNYVYTLEYGNFRKSRQMVLVK